jgi:hypothetical protein
MDILNWLYLAKNKFVRTTLGSTKDLMIFGSNVGFSKRGDKYQNYAMSVEDFSASLQGSVATQGTSLYSTNPATSGFSTSYGIFLGENAGFEANNANNSNFIGISAGYVATDASESNFIGTYAGGEATEASYSNFMGRFAGAYAANANNSNFIGYNAGNTATSAYQSNFIGDSAGFVAYNAHQSNFIGDGAGNGATTANNSNFIGVGAGMESSGNNVNAFGTNAGRENALSGQTIFSNTSMPSFANHGAAALAITVALGGSAGSTYLYDNQATNSIGSVRL